jgi:hypothetical protein
MPKLGLPDLPSMLVLFSFVSLSVSISIPKEEMLRNEFRISRYKVLQKHLARFPREFHFSPEGCITPGVSTRDLRPIVCAMLSMYISRQKPFRVQMRDDVTTMIPLLTWPKTARRNHVIPLHRAIKRSVSTSVF